jgi:FixJ family two-component response regulator
MNISIVDDDESFREAMESLIKSHGYSARTFESGVGFLQADAQGRATDCLIADMHMPGMTGLELHARLAAAGRAVPTILVTGRHDEALRRRALQSGVHCYLTKPVREDHLVGCIRAALAARGAGQDRP